MMRLPCLDDKPYRTLLEEAMARIPAVVPEWTDHNPQDTGILLLELCAAVTEAQIYRIDQSLDGPLARYRALLGGAEPPARAVTESDWEQAALAAPFGLDGAKAGCMGNRVTLTVRRRPALAPGELAALRDWLEPLRLLTVQLTLLGEAAP